MRQIAAILLTFIVLTSCKAKAVTSTATMRHADSVAALRSIAARDLNRVEVWETLVMKADTTGCLVPVSREIRRHTEKAAESVQSADTARFTVQDIQSTNQVEEKAADATDTPRTGFNWFLVGAVAVLVGVVWGLLVLLLRFIERRFL